ncbi:DUF6153 family protein [Streptomyces sp. NPDC059853]|uniref:DUF6153 family protein n=1 Tax=Streptomyces sp. NPDC059853 TaxID=3346973 RepID=UPI00364ABB39
MAPVNRGRGVLLILAVLAGLLAMHGLAPGVVISAGAHHTEVGAPAHDMQGAAHLDHADPDCVAGGTAQAPPLPVPHAGDVVAVVLRAAPAGVTGRGPAPPAPPSLSFLQTLRI